MLGPSALLTKLNRPFLLHFVTLHCFYDINLTISPLYRPVTAQFTKGFSTKTSLINILCLLTIQILVTIIFTNYSQTIDMSTNEQLNSKTNHSFNNSINDAMLFFGIFYQPITEL